MKEHLKSFFNFIFRVDVFNRIIVFVSMCLFIVVPSIILYQIKEYSIDTIKTVIPSVGIIGTIVGTGFISLYKPTRTSWFYFGENFVFLVLYKHAFTNTTINEVQINLIGIYFTEIIYCLIGILINIIYLAIYIKKMKNAFRDNANKDTFFDFLGATNINKEVEKNIDTIASNNKENTFINKLGKIKFSKITRAIIYVVNVIIFIAYIFDLNDFNVLGGLSLFLLLGIIIISITFFASLLFPNDFKYLYYYNSALFSFTGLLASRSFLISPFGFVILLGMILLGMLITLITEGRTWTGANKD